jgi:lipopolysaccharide transport system ATP-binding protein
MSGCTLLLVSHSMQQVMEFCERTVWIERGKVVLDGTTLAVVKAYEEFIQRLAQAWHENEAVIQNRSLVEDALSATLNPIRQRKLSGSDSLAEGGVSAWPGTGRLRISAVWFEDASGAPCQQVRAADELTICVKIAVGEAGAHTMRVGIVIFGPDGRWATRTTSPPFRIEGQSGATREFYCDLAPVRLGPAEYVMSVSLHGDNTPWDINTAERFDLLSRSFTLTVLNVSTRSRN